MENMEKLLRTSRCGQGSNQKSYDDKNRPDTTGGCKYNRARSTPRPYMSSTGNTKMMMNKVE